MRLRRRVGAAMVVITAASLVSLTAGAVNGTPGDDRAVLTPGPDRYAAGAGDDTVLGRAGDDELRGGPGRDHRGR